MRGLTKLAFIEMRAIMVCFNAAAGIRGIHMERVEMSTYLLHRSEILQSVSAGLRRGDLFFLLSS